MWACIGAENVLYCCDGTHDDGTDCKVANCLVCTGWTLAELEGKYFCEDHEEEC